MISLSLLWAVVFVQINFLVFDRAPKPFCEDIIQGSSATIHAELDLFVLQAFQISGTSEVAALITVLYFGHCL